MTDNMMKLCPSLSWRQIVTLVSILFLNLPNGIPWLYGNLITYINSYIFARKGTAGFDLDPTWPLSLFAISYNVGLAAPGFMIKYVGLRVTTLVSVILADLAIFLSYFTAQKSIGFLSLTFGVLSGLGVGAIACVSLHYMCAWFPNHVGRACAFASCSSGGGSIFSNAVITAYINPDDLQPNVVENTAVYFSQDDLLDRVPYIFLVFGVISSALHFLGWILLQTPPSPDEVPTESCNGYTMTVVSANNDSPDAKFPIATCGYKIYTNDRADPEVDSVRDSSEIIINSTINHNGASDKNVRDHSPFEVIRMKSFYLIWLSVGILLYGLLVESNFYKQFGQSLVRDDDFFAVVGSIYSVGNVGGRLLAGYVLDKTGLKMTLLIYLAVNTILFTFWFHSLYAHPYLYAICSIAITTETTAAFVIASYAAIVLYGKLHFSINTGLIFSSNVVVSFLIPLIVRPILKYLGWFWLFQTEAISSLVVFVAVLVFLPETKNHI